jgi:uncharacterized protein (DUF885 family)
MRYFALVTLLLVFPLAFACARDDSAATRAAFRGQLDEEWKYWMEQYPEAATLLGYPGQNAHWTDYSQGAIDARAAYLKKSLERLRGLNRAHLEADCCRRPSRGRASITMPCPCVSSRPRT